MDNATGPKSAIESLRTVEFRLGLRGYDVDEVDDYLEKVAVEADAMQEQLRQATDRPARGQPARAGGRGGGTRS